MAQIPTPEPDDELETRVVALELLLVEVLADLEPGRLQMALARIRAGLAGAVDGREEVARLQAVQHLQDALQRHDGFAPGQLLKPPR